jgi:hypothetical protein
MSSDDDLLVRSNECSKANGEQAYGGDDHPNEREKAGRAAELLACVGAVSADPEANNEHGCKEGGEFSKRDSVLWLDGDLGMILSTSDGSEDGDDSDRQKPNKTNALDSNGNPYQTRTYLLIDPHNGRGTCSAETEGYGEGDGEDGCEPGEADRFALGFVGRGRCAHGELLTADS